MANPDKDCGTEQKDRFMQNFVKSGTAAAVLGLSADRDLLETKTTKNMRKRLGDLSLGSLWGHCPLVVILGSIHLLHSQLFSNFRHRLPPLFAFPVLFVRKIGKFLNPPSPPVRT